MTVAIIDPAIDLNPIQLRHRQEIFDALSSGELQVREVSACPTCDEVEHIVLETHDRFGLPFSARLCTSCGLVFTSPVLDESSLVRFYELHYHPLTFGRSEDFDNLFSSSQGSKVAGYLSDCLDMFDKKELLVAEVGCGACDILLSLKAQLSEKGFSCHFAGTEYVPNLIRRGEEYGFTMLRGGIDSLTQLGRPVDIAILSHVLEHMVDLKAELARLRTISHPNTLIYIEVPGLTSILHSSHFYTFTLRRFLTLAHVYNFTELTLRSVLESSGYDVLKANDDVQVVVRPRNDAGPPRVRCSDTPRIQHYLSRTLPSLPAEHPRQRAFLSSPFASMNIFERNSSLLDLHEEVERLTVSSAAFKGNAANEAILDSATAGIIEHTATMHRLRTRAASLGINMHRSQDRRLSPDLAKHKLSDSERGRLERFRDLHRGERCFIIGNGPSLNRTDLSLLVGEYTIGVNGIFYKHRDVNFSPTYYVVEDNHVIDDNLETINRVDYSIKFFPEKYRDRIVPNSRTYWLPTDWQFYFRSSPDFETPRFSEDITKVIYVGQTVTYLNLQLAFFMGFDPVYLVGVDFSYKIPSDAQMDGFTIISASNDPNHFHPEYFGRGKKWHDPKLDNCRKVYSFAKEFYEYHDRNVINASIDTKLDVFERADYFSIFGRRELLIAPNAGRQFLLSCAVERMQKLMPPSQPLQIIEVGAMFRTSEGESTALLLDVVNRGAHGSTLWTVDLDRSNLAACAELLDKRYHLPRDRWKTLRAHGTVALPKILAESNGFDLAFLDGSGDPITNLAEFKLLECSFKPHSLVVVDDVKEFEPTQSYRLPRPLGKATAIIPYAIRLGWSVWVNHFGALVAPELDLPIMGSLSTYSIAGTDLEILDADPLFVAERLKHPPLERSIYRVRAVASLCDPNDRQCLGLLTTEHGKLIKLLTSSSIPYLAWHGDLYVQV